MNREATRYNELRELLTGPEQRQLAEISERLNDPLRRAEELGQALPDAIAMASNRNGRLARALQPTIDTALKASANKNPKVIADAIFPALGPAIRKAISAALAGMVQSFNHMLNQSFSWQGAKWRIEALRTHKPFAEVVLLHTLIYRVEQIFLIHRRSGLLLYHAVAENIHSKDPDLVSGMLTAIQDFVKDSFDTKTGEMLDTLRMDGDHSVWIEHGPDAVLAAVIRGMPPTELRTRFRDLLEHIHRLYGGSLDDFNGQTSSFALIKPDLEDALTFQARQSKRTLSPLIWLLMAAGLAIGAVWAYHAYTVHSRWKDLVSHLRSERGFVLTTALKIDGYYYIGGFKDPLARSIQDIIALSGLDPNRIRSQWQPFYALDETTVIERARRILHTPATVDLTLSNGMLTIQGKASHAWVKRLRNQVGSVPGIQGYDDTGLDDIELDALRTAIAGLEQQTLYFQLGRARIETQHKETLSRILDALARIEALTASMGIRVPIAVIGQTDPTGRQAFNTQLSQRRAQAVLSYLIQNSIDPASMHAIGSTVNPLEADSPASKANQAFRTVTFKAYVGAE